VEQIMLKKR